MFPKWFVFLIFLGVWAGMTFLVAVFTITVLGILTWETARAELPGLAMVASPLTLGLIFFTQHFHSKSEKGRKEER